MLLEYAIIPEVFEDACYGSPDVCDLRLSELKQCLLARGLVRNLHGGAWEQHINTNRARWNRRGLELYVKLAQHGRLSLAGKHSATTPDTSESWCDEALQSHASKPLRGVICGKTTKEVLKGNDLVADVSKLNGTKWWHGNACTQALQRTLADYQSVLEPVLQHSRSLMFIDPHLDPTKSHYGDFLTLLLGCSANKQLSKIEIHRVCYSGSGADRKVQPQQIEHEFESKWETALQQAQLGVEVFLWDDFHDRFLISNLIGIGMPNGFDTEKGKVGTTRWSRLDRSDSDDVQREFDPAARRHELRHHFRIGKHA